MGDEHLLPRAKRSQWTSHRGVFWWSQESHPQVEYDLCAKNSQSFDSVWGADAQSEAHGEGVAAGAGEARPPRHRRIVSASGLRGGTYAEAQALTLINSQYFIGLTDNEVGIYRVNDDGSATFIPEKDFKLLLANVRVRRKEGKQYRQKSSGVSTPSA